MPDRAVRRAPERLRIAVPEQQLDDLRSRLRATRWPDALPGSGWDYGTDLGYLQELCAYWADGYDWRAQEAALNRYPLYRCEVDGLDLHFWWVRGRGERTVPLLLLHGWPGGIHLRVPRAHRAADRSGGHRRRGRRRL